MGTPRACHALLGIGLWLAGRSIPSIRLEHVFVRSGLAPLPDILVRGTTVVVVYVGLLAVSGFFQAEELARCAGAPPLVEEGPGHQS